MEVVDDSWTLVLHLTNSAVGVGILALPFCFAKAGTFPLITLGCGFLLGTLVLLFCAHITKVSCRLVTASCRTTKSLGFQGSARITIGSFGCLIIEILNACFLFGSMVAFLNVAGNMSLSLIFDHWDVRSKDGISFLYVVAVFIFTTVIALPLSLYATVRLLGQLSFIAFAAYALLVVHLAATALPILKSSDGITLALWRPEGVLFVLPIFSGALLMQPQLSVVVDDVQRHGSSLLDAVGLALGVCCCLYFCVAFFGYVSYQDRVQGDILLSLEKGRSAWLIRFAFLVSLAVSYPLMLFPCRLAVLGALEQLSVLSLPETLPFSGKHSKPPVTCWGVTTFAIVFLSALLAVVSPNVEFILGLCGSLAGSAVGYILPALVYLCAYDARDWYRRFEATLCLTYGLSMMLVSTIVVFELEIPQPGMLISSNDNSATTTINAPAAVDDASTSATTFAFAHEAINATLSLLRSNFSGRPTCSFYYAMATSQCWDVHPFPLRICQKLFVRLELSACDVSTSAESTESFGTADYCVPASHQSVTQISFGFIYPALVYLCDRDNSQKSFKHTLARVYLICQLAVMLVSVAVAVELEQSSL
ncbi:Sodium coupled neutral amino acid transporter [Trichuris trichiura]|uniref:Sodium coupled neutral amino acid transporter n=1 Tax=Trichuris trichiura TaxID=36087 RepID=A0A077Z6Q2_TRITR|nr:Sodium coupled neutral amino acid transporter [Trichuris trichiura]